MAEVAPAGGGPNRMFIAIVVGLVGLLVVGALGVLGFFLIPRLQGLAAAPATPTLIRPISTPTRAIALAPTATLEPSPTATLVVAPVAPAPAGAGTPTTVVTGTTTAGTPGTGMPQTGVGEDLLLLAGGVVLVLIIFAVRQARSTGTA